MSALFTGIGSAFGALLTGGRSGQPYVVQAPQLPAPVAPPATPTPASSANDGLKLAGAFTAAQGSQSTIATGGLGDTSTATTQRKTLLGG